MKYLPEGTSVKVNCPAAVVTAIFTIDESADFFSAMEAPASALPSSSLTIPVTDWEKVTWNVSNRHNTAKTTFINSIWKRKANHPAFISCLICVKWQSITINGANNCKFYCLTKINCVDLAPSLISAMYMPGASAPIFSVLRSGTIFSFFITFPFMS